MQDGSEHDVEQLAPGRFVTRVQPLELLIKAIVTQGLLTNAAIPNDRHYGAGRNLYFLSLLSG